MTPNDGGNAFPSGRLDTNGMSLRDYFAAHALLAMSYRELTGIARDSDLTVTEAMSIAAYRLADALIAERAK